MRASRNDTEALPDELHEALSEAGFDQLRKHSRWTYARVFVRNEADTPPRALTRHEVEADLQDHTAIDPAKSSSHPALTDLVEAGILDRDTSREPHQYWLSHSLNPQANETTEDTAASEPNSTSGGSEHSSSPRANDAEESRFRYLAFERLWLSALVVGLSLTLLTLVLLRLSAPPTLSIGSAALSWGALSIGFVVIVVSVFYHWQ
jgi:hypothetical protein